LEGLKERLRQATRWESWRLVRRITAWLLVGQGQGVEEVAEIVGVHPNTLYRWLRAFMLHRFDRLKYRTSGGRPPKLTKTQRQRLKEVILDGPEKAGYDTGCWTSLLIQEYIEREFKVYYHRRYLCTLLEELGLSYQKATFVSDHLDPEKRVEWQERTWPEILRQAREQNAWLLFVDEVIFSQWGSLGYTWALKGQQPVVRTTGKRQGYKRFGAIDYFTGQSFFHSCAGRFNSETYQEFLRFILKRTKRRVILVQDGAKDHTSRALQDFFRAHADRLTAPQWPSYSPDFNPMEHLWKKVKERTHNRYFPQFEDLVDVVDRRWTYFEEHPEEVRRLMLDYPVEAELIKAA